MPNRDWSTGTRLKLRHLQLVAAVGSLGNLGSAARRLNITQPAASRLLAEIETLVGEQIFDRVPRGLTANLYGEVLVRRAQVCLAGLKEAGEEVNVLRSGYGGKVTLGVVSEPAVDIAAGVLTRLLKQSSSLQLTVEVAPSIPLIKRLRDGEIDIALARLAANGDADEFEYIEVGPELLSLIVRHDHDLAAGGPVSLSDISDEHWVMEQPGSMLRRTVEEAFRKSGVTPPKKVLCSASLIFVLSVVLEGGIIGVLPSSVTKIVEQDKRYHIVSASRLKDPISVEPYGLIRDLRRPPTPAAMLIYDMIHSFVFRNGAYGSKDR